MARRYRDPITVEERGGVPYAFTWRGVTYRVRVIGMWRLATRWWESDNTVNRHYFRVQSADQQIFELDCEHGTSARQGVTWVLDVCLD
ncbi:MAG TPA: DUF6504 family protein [Ktedonobacterales bacterium]|nr:DUF6504 family protein [Ktedonobacterales bacterium]